MDKTKPISIQMRRLSDEFVYHFYPTHEVDGYMQYRRLDKNIIPCSLDNPKIIG
jgi:hypothetical protein